MNFFRIFELFLETHGNTQENNNTTRTKETSIDQCHSQINDNNSNKLECIVTINNNKDCTPNDSSVVSIEEFGVTKILHNLENIAPIDISPSDNIYKKPKENEISLNDDVVPEDEIIFNNATDVSSVVTVIEDEPDTNQISNDLTQIQGTHKSVVSNVATYKNETDAFNNDIDNETIENLKEFEEALNIIDKTALADDSGTQLINLDDFIELFDELNDENEDLVSINDSVLSDFKNKEIATYCKENDITNPNKNETNENIDIISINSSIDDEKSQTKEIKDTISNSNINENIDIISINSSIDDEKSQTKEIKDTISIHAPSDEPDSDDGYNSSDFEFISETEANMTGFLINCRLKDYQNLSGSEPLVCSSGQYFDDKGEKEAFDPGEGPSRQNRPKNEFEDRSYRNDHHIPIGDDYLGLFQGIYNPQLPMSEIYFLENKSVRASAMNSQYDGIGFDKQLALRRHQPDSSEDEFEDEAKESAKKILNMYPRENRKRRRRYL